MPIYGKEKTKTMIRSVLPSSARKEAKKRKDGLHRLNRRTANNNLRNYKGYCSDLEEHYEDDCYDYDLWHEPHRHNYGGWDDIVYDRRDSDKLLHFETWAYRTTLHLPPDQRFKKISSMMTGVLGTHALSHLEFLKYDPLERDVWHDNLPTQYRRRHYYSYNSKYYLNRNRIRQEVKDAIYSIARDDKKRKAFNEYMLKNASKDILEVNVRDFSQNKNFYKVEKKKIVYTGARTLNGYHDVTKFLRDIYAAQKNDPKLGYHPSWMQSVINYFKIQESVST